MTSSHEYADHQRMSADVSNKTSFTTVNNNPSSSTSAVDCVTSSPVIRASTGTASDQTASVSNRRSDFADYRPGSGSGSGTASGSSSFWSPKLECRGAGSGGTSAKKAQRTSHSSAGTSSTAGKWQKKMSDVSMSMSGGGRSQASDSVRCSYRGCTSELIG